MTKIKVVNPDGIEVPVEIDMDNLWSLAHCFMVGTKIKIPAGYFSDVGAEIIITEGERA